MDESTLLESFNNLSPAILKYVSRTINSKPDAQDILQDCFVWLWTHRESLENITNLRSFLYGMVRHMMSNHIRHLNIERDYIKYFITNHRNVQTNPVDIHSILENAITKLSDREREVFVMSRSLAMSNTEIAERLGIGKRTVENHISSSLKKIRAFLS